MLSSDVKIQSGLTHEEVVSLDDCLYRYNVLLIGRDDLKDLSIGKYDAFTEGFLGGAKGTTYWDWLKVTELWCDHRTYGEREGELLDQLEIQAAERGCHSSWICLMDWDLVDLFRTSGYEEFARLPDYAPGHDHLFLKKTIKGKQLGHEPVFSMEINDTDLWRIHHTKKAHESSIASEYSPRLIAVSARDNGRLVGGAQGYVNRQWFYVDLMFVDESYRRKGVATAFLKSLEDEARIAGCKNINVETFFAREFYMANGFEVFGSLDGFAGKHPNYFLKKTL